MARLRAHFDGKVLVPLDRVDLPTGRVLDIEVLEGDQPQRGSATAVLLAARQPPHIPIADIDELERALDAAKLPVKYDCVFGAQE